MELTIVVDLQWGSCGKGKLVSELARELPFDACAASNMPNAGHTVIAGDGRVVFKCLCSATPWTGVSLVTPSSVFSTDRLDMEATHTSGGVYVHENAQSLLPRDAYEEAEDVILRQVASTSQGCTPAMIRRLRRSAASRVGSLNRVWPANVHVVKTSEWRRLLRGRILCEVSQGFGLSVDWGDFPYTTSRNCTPTDFMAALGAPPNTAARVIGICRSYPIRVGNADGFSGPMGTELSWDEVAARSGLNAEELKRLEHTTVTGRLRRVSEADLDRLAVASRACGVDTIFVNFAQYWDARDAGVTVWDALSPTTKNRVCGIEEACDAHVCGVGTGETTTAWRPGWKSFLTE